MLFETTTLLFLIAGNCCELLAFNLYLCSLKQQDNEMDLCPWGCELLAFNLYLCSLKQRNTACADNNEGCELLAFNLYLCSLKQQKML